MKKILVVEDDPLMAELIADFCRERGYEAKIASDGLAANELAQSWNPDAITLDLGLPGLNGLGVVEELQSRPETRGIPVVVISAVAKPAVLSGLLRRGVRFAFQKPLRLERFGRRLREIMEANAPWPEGAPPLEA
jgi:CheY-like chemotaxis protein